MNEQIKDSRKRQGMGGSLWQWARRLTIGVVALVLLLVLTGLAYQAIAAARDARLFAHEYPQEVEAIRQVVTAVRENKPLRSQGP
jgi:hypothetical protein